jgi:multidrug resistance efflux pump
MRPTPIELVVRIREALDSAVLPHVEDKLAASSLRSARALLDHLASRLANEDAFLSDDNADARAVLAKATAALDGDEAQALQAAMPDLGQDDPAAANEGYQRALEVAIAAAHRRYDTALHAEIRGYLSRRLGRERDMFYPAFTAPPF